MFTLLTKPGNYEKDKNKALLDEFNVKLKKYNALIQGGAPKNLRIALLQEIDFFVQDLRLKSSSPTFKSSNCSNKILAWDEMPNELKQLNISALPGLPMEKQLYDNTTYVGPLMSAKQWSNAFKNKNKMQITDPIAKDLKELAKLHDNIDKYYSLKQIQAKILTAINEEKPDGTERAICKKLSLQINKELSKLIKQTPELKKRYEEHASLAQDLREDLDKLSSEEREAVVFGIIKPQGGPSFSGYQTTELSRGNNTTWKLTNEKNQETFTLRAESLLSHPVLIEKLRQSSVNEYFSQDYMTYFAEKNLVISEFAERGDMRSNRKNNNSSFSDNDIILSASEDILQITDLSNKLLKNGAMHADIKLSNFLLHGNGTMFITDKKALIPIDPNGQVKIKDISTTAHCAPPEFKGNDTNININAEHFMSYQIGLAIYEHLVLPELKAEKLWTKKPLDFNHKIFETPLGKEMQILIKKATDDKPENRIGLKELHGELNRIKLQAQLQAQLEVSIKNLQEYQGSLRINPEKHGKESDIKHKKAEELLIIINSATKDPIGTKIELEQYIKNANQTLKHKGIINRFSGSEFTLVKIAKEMHGLVTKLCDATPHQSLMQKDNKSGAETCKTYKQQLNAIRESAKEPRENLEDLSTKFSH